MSFRAKPRKSPIAGMSVVDSDAPIALKPIEWLNDRHFESLVKGNLLAPELKAQLTATYTNKQGGGAAPVAAPFKPPSNPR